MTFQKKFKIAERCLTAFIALFLVSGFFMPGGIVNADYEPWVQPTTSSVSGVGGSDTEEAAERAEDDEPNTVTKIIAEGIGYVGTAINKGFKGNEGLDASITGIIMGKVVNGKSYFVFDLGDDCIWGKVGAVIYVCLRAIMIMLLFVAVVAQVIVPLWKGDSRGGALIKNGLLTFTVGILIITVMPLIVDWLCVVRDRLCIVIYKGVDAYTSSVGHSVSYTATDGTTVSATVDKSLGNSIDAVYYNIYTDKPNIVNALLYLVVCCLPLMFIINYIKIAIIQTVLFGLFPMFGFVGTMDKGETIKKWAVTFATNCLIPCIDMALIFIPSLLISAMMDTEGFDSSSLVVLIILVVCFFAIVPVRNQILGLFGNGGGWGLENGTTLGGILAGAASVAAGAIAGAAGIFSDYKKNTEGASSKDLEEAEKAEAGLNDSDIAGEMNDKANTDADQIANGKEDNGDKGGNGFEDGENDPYGLNKDNQEQSESGGPEEAGDGSSDGEKAVSANEITSDEGMPENFDSSGNGYSSDDFASSGNGYSSDDFAGSGSGNSSDDFAGSGEQFTTEEGGGSASGFNADSDTHQVTRNGDDVNYATASAQTGGEANEDVGVDNVTGENTPSGGNNSSEENNVNVANYDDVSGGSSGQGSNDGADSADSSTSDRAERDESTSKMIDELSVSGSDMRKEAEKDSGSDTSNLASEINQNSYVDSKKQIDHSNFNMNRAANLQSMSNMSGAIKDLDKKNAELKADSANKTKEMRAAQKDLNDLYKSNGIRRDENGHYDRKAVEEKMRSDENFRRDANKIIDRINDNRDAVEANKDAISMNNAHKEGLQQEIGRRQDIEKQYAGRYAAAGHTGQTFSSAEEFAGHLKQEERARNIVNLSNYKDKKFDGVLSESQRIQYQREAAKREAVGRLASGGAIAMANVAAAPIMVASGNINTARQVSRAATNVGRAVPGAATLATSGTVAAAKSGVNIANKAVTKAAPIVEKMEAPSVEYMQTMLKRSQGRVRNANTNPPVQQTASSQTGTEEQHKNVTNAQVNTTPNSARATDVGTDNYEARANNRESAAEKAERYDAEQRAKADETANATTQNVQAVNKPDPSKNGGAETQ